MTKNTKEEETAALAEAQNDMEETAKANGALLVQAKEWAKILIEGYVKKCRGADWRRIYGRMGG